MLCVYEDKFSDHTNVIIKYYIFFIYVQNQFNKVKVI